ncbi:chitin deacetylase [Cryptococcus neoformans]|nr:chitin deacetylase [Cryptococcus neoformans var. grubii]OWZ69454.1 chitin deacetylase [Cryptococcus neoformans var. grubii]OXG18793.1 chitin deacetylase [Cryptococcus neoformans var. grubii Tu401-1]
MYGHLSLSALSLLAVVAAAPFRESWLQPRDSPVSQLFRRTAPDPNSNDYMSYYPGPGSTPNVSTIPQAWLDKLATVNLPNVPVATPDGGRPTYPNNEDDGDSTICSFTDQCRVEDDLYSPPGEKIWALSFDDGPTDVSPALYDYLAQNNISSSATHFMIGGNVITSPQSVLVAVKAGGHLAVHTWSHPYMTTLTNEQVVGELGWTMQALSDLNGGRIPMYWRPPYGDVDNRVRAIAKEVFGLVTVLWDSDTNDWAITDEPGQYSVASVEAYFDTLVTGNRTQGLLLLEHELDNNTVEVFETEYPKAVGNGWTVKNVADAFNMEWYLNSGKGNNDVVTTMSVAGTLTTATPTNTSTYVASSTAASSASVTDSAGVSIASAASSEASSSWAIANRPSHFVIAIACGLALAAIMV